MIKRILKIAGILTLLALAGLLITGWMLHEPRPSGQAGPEAEAMARNMQTAINLAAWDTTHLVRWNFDDRHHLLWDRQRNWVQVQWRDNRVLVILDKVEGLAWKNGKAVNGAMADKLVQKAWAIFCNDSYWLNAPAKAYDPGTSRETVTLEGKSGLLVSYASGGVTPGDAYWWELAADGTPTHWKMWVSILPVGGIRVSWDDWVTLPTGARIATTHHFGDKFTTHIKDLQSAQSWEEWGLTEDPFAPIEMLVSAQ